MGIKKLVLLLFMSSLAGDELTIEKSSFTLHGSFELE